MTLLNATNVLIMLLFSGQVYEQKVKLIMLGQRGEYKDSCKLIRWKTIPSIAKQKIYCYAVLILVTSEMLTSEES